MDEYKPSLPTELLKIFGIAVSVRDVRCYINGGAKSKADSTQGDTFLRDNFKKIKNLFPLITTHYQFLSLNY
jgi:hypothetical protein